MSPPSRVPAPVACQPYYNILNRMPEVEVLPACAHFDLGVVPDSPMIAAQMVARLVEDPDWLSYGDRWILRALLPEVNLGHRNLAEAIIMLAGEPLPAEQILGDLDFDKQLPAETRAIALEMALSKDERFRNVGALEAPLWTLKSQI